MKLSVIIVNYNVKYFIEQALLSVRKASEGLAVEVIVVDNNSVDGSVELVKTKFPEVRLIANTQNVGFSTANNQGITISKGKYVLLLNPDTIVEEDTFKECIRFMDETSDAGALGVKMYDGKGIYLPESKRGLPNPMVALYKMTGLGNIFPKSKRFNYYYLGHLEEDEIHEIEVLSGAFMFMRKSVLDKVGYLDETFFMYGEDIDLSYRITQGGFKNYYFPNTRIIHYKGESTKKGSLNYVRVFYNAMIIFAKKHFQSDKAQFYILGIYLAIYFKAALTIGTNFLRKTLLPLTDAALLYAGMWLLKDFWQNNIKYTESLTYPPEYLLVNVPLYIFIWLISIFFSGGYDRPLRPFKVVRGVLFGTLVISAVYGFLPESYRFSRAMIILGTFWATFSLVAWRFLLHFLKYKKLPNEVMEQRRTIIVGGDLECQRVQGLLYQSGIKLDIIGFINSLEQHPTKIDDKYVGRLEQLKEIVDIYKIEEVIFCAKDIASQRIIQFMIDIGQTTNYKIVPQESLSIIGSNSKNTAGDLYTIDINLNLNRQNQQRNKRVLDLFFCLFFILFFPLILGIKNKKGFVKNWLKVFVGKMTWVAYAPFLASTKDKASSEHLQNIRLPKIKKGVLSPFDGLSDFQQLSQANQTTLHRLNLLYAKDYQVVTDIEIVFKSWRKLGQS